MAHTAPLRLAAVIALSVATASSAFAQLSGTYTIPTDYATLNDATIALNTQGVTGPVIFELQSGVYTDRSVIDAYAGASAATGVTIRPAPGATVRFAPTATTSADNHVILLRRASHVAIEGLTFDPGGATLERGIFMTGGHQGL